MAASRLAFFLIAAALLACNDATSPATGKAEITLTVSGLDLDPNGYNIMVDGDSAAFLAGAGLTTIHARFGEHTIALGGLAPNCTLQRPGSQPVTISSRATATVSFAVVCTAVTGVVQVTGSTTGLDLDADGYQVLLNGSPVQPVGANGTLWISAVSAGTHSLSVSGLAPNCSVVGSNPVDVTVSAGGLVRDTARVALTVQCTAATGVVQVTTVTTGPDQDPDGYSIAVDGGSSYTVATNGTGWVLGVSAGAHSVGLSGVAANCSVTGSNPVTFNVTTGGLVRDTARTTMNVTCIALPRTGADLVVATTGANLDDQYYVTITSRECGYYCYATWNGDVPANGTVSLVLPADTYDYLVSDIAGNCSGPGLGSFSVTSQHVTTVPLAYTCVITGTVSVNVNASGLDLPDYYTIAVDGTPRSQTSADGHVSIVLPVGTHSIALPTVNPNCTVAAPTAVSVNVTANSTSNVGFSVTCVANPTLRVTVTTSGSNAPANYLVGVDPDYYYGYLYSASIPSNGTVSIKVLPGMHEVTLDDVPLNCTVTSPNNVSINVPLGNPTDLAFTVSCH